MRSYILQSKFVLCSRAMPRGWRDKNSHVGKRAQAGLHIKHISRPWHRTKSLCWAAKGNGRARRYELKVWCSYICFSQQNFSHSICTKETICDFHDLFPWSCLGHKVSLTHNLFLPEPSFQNHPSASGADLLRAYWLARKSALCQPGGALLWPQKL